MKRIVFLCLALCLVASFAFAEEAVTETTASAVTSITPTVTPVLAPETITIKGTIIDNMCAEASRGDLAEFVKAHSKVCALMPDCVASGYSIYADGKLTKFDKDSNAKVEEFLNKEDSKLDVVVTVKMAQDELSLVSIMNQ